MTFSLNILETHDLTMRFGGITAIKEVNFTLEFGELRCLIGPNGAGKSTFFKCLTGQYMPSQGEVILRGNSVNGAGVDRIARSGVGIKTQVPSIFDGT
jgi:branched-chain amino acid transport system ATP-binding protein